MDISAIKRDLFKDLEIKEFCSKNKLSDLDILNNLNKLYIHKEYNNKANECSKTYCVMDPYGMHTRIIYKNNNVELEYVACPTLEKQILGNINLMFFPNQKELVSSVELYQNDNRIETLSHIIDFLNEYRKGEFTKGIYLHGPFGTGKTFIMYHLAKLLATKGVNVIIINYADFIVNLKNSFGTSDTERILNELKYVDVLIIDDIGAESNTAYTRDDVLYPLINFRLQSRLPVCMTSNYNFSDLAIHFGEAKDAIDKLKSARIMDRLRYLMTPIELKDKSYRL